MNPDELWDADIAQEYDTPGIGLFDPAVLGPTVDRLASLAGSGRALEFAIGTGRVALPLSARGISVTGIELSSAMIEQLRTKPGHEQIAVRAGDMTTTRAPGEFSLVYLVYNTISNLLTQAEQVACFANAARHLSPGGCFVIELWVPELRALPRGQAGTVFHSEAGYLAELDLMAQLAGFALESRHADWAGSEFTADSRSHVSVYRLAGTADLTGA